MPTAKRQRVVPGLRKRPRAATVSDGTKALRLVRKLNRQQESKVSTLGGTVVANNHVEHLTGIPEGSTGGTRDGLAIVGKHIEFSGSIRDLSVSTKNAAKYVHLGVVVDLRQVHSDTPNWGTIWDNTLPQGVMLDRENLQRFKVLYNRRFLIHTILANEITNNAPGTANDVNYIYSTQMFKVKLALKDLDIRFQTETATSINKHGVYMTFAFSNDDGTVTSDANMELRFAARLTFKDP